MSRGQWWDARFNAMLRFGCIPLGVATLEMLSRTFLVCWYAEDQNTGREATSTQTCAEAPQLPWKFRTHNSG